MACQLNISSRAKKKLMPSIHCCSKLLQDSKRILKRVNKAMKSSFLMMKKKKNQLLLRRSQSCSKLLLKLRQPRNLRATKFQKKADRRTTLLKRTKRAKRKRMKLLRS